MITVWVLSCCEECGVGRKKASRIPHSAPCSAADAGGAAMCVQICNANSRGDNMAIL